jgi:hypothetical protein
MTNDEFVLWDRERLARTMLRKEALDKEQKQRYHQLISDLETESVAWLTPDNFTSKLTPEFFSRPSTTGLVTPYTKYWKTHVLTFALNRRMSPELEQSLLPNEEDALLEEAERGKHVEAMIEKFMEGFVSTGEDRLILKDAVREVAKAHGVTLYDDYDEKAAAANSSSTSTTSPAGIDQETSSSEATRDKFKIIRRLDILHSKGLRAATADDLQEEETVLGPSLGTSTQYVSVAEDPDDKAVPLLGEFNEDDDSILSITDDDDSFDKFVAGDDNTSAQSKKDADKKKAGKKKDSKILAKKKGKK